MGDSARSSSKPNTYRLDKDTRAAIPAGTKCRHTKEQVKPHNALPIRYAPARNSCLVEKKSRLQQSNSPGSDSDSAVSNSESEDESTDGTDGDEDEWSGVNDGFETAILQAVFPDLELAAHLITQLYTMFYPGSSRRISRKVSSWRENIRTCPTDSGTASTEKGPVSSSNATLSLSKQGSSKRDRLSGSTDSNIDEEEGDGDDSDENRRKRIKDNSLDARSVMPSQRFACPFNKMEPSRYCQFSQEGEVTDKKYRSCTGPGFKSLQLLKCTYPFCHMSLADHNREHLKRVHYPVQCDRCYVVFPYKKNRSLAVSELERHRQLDEPCPRNTTSMKEGISDAQWTSLEEKK